MAVGATDPWARNMGASPRVRHTVLTRNGFMVAQDDRP